MSQIKFCAYSFRKPTSLFYTCRLRQLSVYPGQWLTTIGDQETSHKETFLVLLKIAKVFGGDFVDQVIWQLSETQTESGIQRNLGRREA